MQEFDYISEPFTSRYDREIRKCKACGRILNSEKDLTRCPYCLTRTDGKTLEVDDETS